MRIGSQRREERPVAKGARSAVRTKSKGAKKTPRLKHEEATVEEFEREGMGVAPKE